MGGTSDRLRERARRRHDWLAEATARFAGDDDVAGAWVFGSEGRGDADELSDLDVFVAFADPVAASALLAIDDATFRAFGEVVTWVDVSERAPEGGRAFVVAYRAPVEPLTVEWWFHGASAVQLGSDVRVLVDKVGMAVANPPLPTTSLLPAVAAAKGPSRRADRLQERLTWFWATAPVAAKWLARGWIDRADEELERMSAVVDEATAFLHEQPGERQIDLGPMRPLGRLRSVMVELAVLHEALSAAGLEVPATDRAYGWLELAEDLEAEGWTPNSVR